MHQFHVVDEADTCPPSCPDVVDEADIYQFHVVDEADIYQFHVTDEANINQPGFVGEDDRRPASRS